MLLDLKSALGSQNVLDKVVDIVDTVDTVDIVDIVDYWLILPYFFTVIFKIIGIMFWQYKDSERDKKNSIFFGSQRGIQFFATKSPIF